MGGTEKKTVILSESAAAGVPADRSLSVGWGADESKDLRLLLLLYRKKPRAPSIAFSAMGGTE